MSNLETISVFIPSDKDVFFKTKILSMFEVKISFNYGTLYDLEGTAFELRVINSYIDRYIHFIDTPLIDDRIKELKPIPKLIAV